MNQSKQKINKAKEARKWLLRDWKLTQAMAIEKWKLFRLAPVVERMNKGRKIVENIGDPGSYGIYKLVKK